MQTFLAYSNFRASINCLDQKRHGKQRIEAYDCYGLITNFKTTNHTDAQKELLLTRYSNHPLPWMWAGWEDALAEYYNICIELWDTKGYENNMPHLKHQKVTYPSWLGNKALHASHRSNLLRKNPEFYGQYEWTEPDNLPYIWPV